MRGDRYTKREYELMFTLDVAAYVNEHNLQAGPDDQINTDAEWIGRWKSAYELEKWRAAHTLAEINADVHRGSADASPETTAWWIENMSLHEIEEAILHALDLQAELDLIRRETNAIKANRDAKAAAAAEALRMERVFLGLEQPRAGDSLPEWLRLEIEAEDLGWQPRAGGTRRRKSGKQNP